MTKFNYKDHVGIIRKLTYQFHRSSGLNLDDLIGEANLAFVLARDSYDESKGKPSTWIWNTVVLHLRNYCKKEIKYAPLEEWDDSNQINENHKSRFIDLIDSLSQEAKEVVQTILKSPSEICELVNPHSGAVPVVAFCKWLVQQGWKWESALLVRQEIKNTLKNC